MTTMRTQTFAHHCTSIMMQEANGKPQTYYPCDGVVAEVVVKPAHWTDDFIWNQVFINGKWCGNRHGGVKAFANMVNCVQPTLECELDEHSMVPMCPMDHPNEVAMSPTKSMIERLRRKRALTPA